MQVLKSFTSISPNAGLTTFANSKLQTTTVELSRPVMEGMTLRDDVKVIKDEVPPFGAPTSLFIDDNPWNPSGFLRPFTSGIAGTARETIGNVKAATS